MSVIKKILFFSLLCLTLLGSALAAVNVNTASFDDLQTISGIGPRMASKIGVTGHAIVDPYVEPQFSGWDGAGFTKRHGEALHKVIYFDLVANRGIPAFSLTFDGGYSPGSIHSAGQLHAFMNQIAPVISRREFLADIGLASSSWSQIAAQPPWAWKNAVTKRHTSEFLGWAQYLRARLERQPPGRAGILPAAGRQTPPHR